MDTTSVSQKRGKGQREACVLTLAPQTVSSLFSSSLVFSLFAIVVVVNNNGGDLERPFSNEP